jgi:hypothetical protein
MKANIEHQLTRLTTMATGSLRELWRDLFGAPPHRKLRREILIPILAYRIQEKALGGLRLSTARRLQADR